MRVEWELDGFDLDRFRSELFAPLAAELGMTWKLTSSARKPRVALFCSQYLHCMADLLHRWRTGELVCEIPLIVSNHREVENLAAFYGVPFEFVPVTADTRAEAEARQLELLAQHDIELVVLARYMQILSPAFVAQYPAAIINVHHSFLPAFTGARPYHAAHARGVKLIGATSHYVTEVLDDGPIIEQDVARITIATRWRTWWRGGATWSAWCFRGRCAGTWTGGSSATGTRRWCSISADSKD